MLFISHNTSRTGAPILLLNLLRLLKKQGYSADVLVREEIGDLGGAFGEVYPTRYFYHSPAQSIKKRGASKLRRMAGMYPYQKEDYRLVFNNTIVNGAIIGHYGHLPVVTYVHELEHVVKSQVKPRELEAVLAHTKLFLYPSEAVRTMLVQHLKIDARKLRHLPYYIEDHFHKRATARTQLRRELGIGEGQVLIGGMGVPSWRKGSDFFLLLASRFRNDERVRFVWVGSDGENNQNAHFNQLVFDKEKMGLDRLSLVPAVPDSWRYMAAMDLFFLSSREDPYPLVVLEAGMMQLPLACFEGSGGATEFITEDCGQVLPYLDIAAAEAMVTYCLEHPERYAEKGKCARERYLAKHTEEVVLEAFREVVEGMGGRGADG